MSFVQNSIKKLDIFGSKVTLNYQGDILYRTSFGGVMAVSLVSFLVILFFRSVWTLIQRSTVTYTSQISFDEDPSVVELGGLNSMLAVKYDQTNFISAPWMNITFEYRFYNKTPSGVIAKTKVAVPLEPCTLSHFVSFTNNQYNWTDAYYNNGLGDYLCLPKGQTYKIGGAFTTQNFYHLKFTMTKCKNSTSTFLPWNPTCDTPANIAAGVSSQNRLLLVFTNRLVNPTKTTDPVKTYLDTQFFNVQPQIMYSTANVYVNKQVVKTDHSIFPMTDIEQNEYQAFAPNDYKPSQAVGNFSNYMELYIHRSPFTTTTNRKYTKIDEVISYMGGFCQVFLLFASLVVNFYNDYVYTIELANRLYDFDIDKNNKNKNNHNNQHPPSNDDNKQKDISKRLDESQRNPRELTNPNESAIKNGDTSIKKQPSLQSKKSQSFEMKKPFFESNNNPGFNLQLMKVLSEKESTEKKKNMLDDPPSMIGRKIGSTENTLPDGTPRGDSSRPLSSLNQHQQTNKKNKDLEALQEELESQIPSHNSVIKESKSQGNDPCQNDEIRGYSNSRNEIGSGEKIDDNNEGQKRAFESFQHQDSLNCRKNSIDETQLAGSLPMKQSEGTSYVNNNKWKLQQQLSFSKDQSQLGYSRKLSKNDFLSENILLPNQQSNQIDESNRQTPSNAISKLTNKAYQTKLFLEKELRAIIQRNRSLYLNYKYIINKLSFGKLYNTEEVQLLTKADELVRQDLDIFMILDRLKELEKLKQLLFSSEQQTIFNFFPKPLISIKESSKKINARELAEEAKKETKFSNQATKKGVGNLKLSLKNIGIVTKAVTRFKKNAFQNKISDYQKLYFCFEKLLEQAEKQQDTKLNKKLVDLLGTEMQRLFILTRHRSLKEKQEEKTVDLNFSRNNLTPKNNCFQEQASISPEKQQQHSLQQHSISKFKFMSQEAEQPTFSSPKSQLFSVNSPSNTNNLQGEDILVQFDDDDDEDYQYEDEMEDYSNAKKQEPQ